MYNIVYRKQVIKDIPKLKAIGLSNKAKSLIDIIKINPHQVPPPYEKLVGDLQGAYSRRINIQYTLVYQVLEEEKTIKILNIWSHYENV